MPTLAVAGYIADRIESRRKPLLAGLPALVVSTTLLYIGNSLTLWVIGRILMGISAAVTWTVGLALLVDTVNKDRLGESLGYMSMGMMVGTTSGPLLGGIIYEGGGYHSVFAAAFVLILIDTILRFVMLEKKDVLQKLAHAKDVTEDILASAPLLGSPTSPSVPSYGMAADTTARGAQVAENGGKSLPEPSSPILTLLSMPQIRICLWAYCIISMSLTSFDSALPLFVRDTFSWSQLGQGLIFLPLSVTQVIDPIAGMICDKYPKGRRYIAAMAFSGAGTAFLSLRIVTHDSLAQKIWLSVLLVALGLCMSFAVSPILVSIDEILIRTEEERQGAFGKGGAVALAYGLVNAAFATGALLGPFFGGYIRSVAGWGTMTIILAAFNLFTGVVMLYLCSPSPAG